MCVRFERTKEFPCTLHPIPQISAQDDQYPVGHYKTTKPFSTVFGDGLVVLNEAQNMGVHFSAMKTIVHPNATKEKEVAMIMMKVYAPTETETTTEENPETSIYPCLYIEEGFTIRSGNFHTNNLLNLLEDVNAAEITVNRMSTTQEREHIFEHLCEGALRVMNEPNAGGNSVYSEVMSMQIMKTLFNAELVHTEMEVRYSTRCKITDYSINIGPALRIGVSVTRAMKFGDGLFDEEDARRLLAKKLYGIVESTKWVVDRCRWRKQILHIFVEEEYMVGVLKKVYAQMDEELIADSVVLCTVSEDAAWVFYG